MILNINHILNNLSELNLNIRKDRKKRKLPAFIDNAKNAVNENIKKGLNYISRKNEDVKRLEYERNLNVFVPIHIRIRKLVSKLTLDKEVKDLLPYYYYQLFTGKHQLKKTDFSTRQREVAEFKSAFGGFDDSIKPVVLITGEAGVGKSHFIHNVLANVIKEKSAIVNIDDFSVKKPLEKALRKLIGKSGNIDFLMNSIPSGTTVVFEDIEKLISAREKDERLLNVLAKIIDKYSHKFSFLLSANINSLKTIDTMSSLMSSILSTITIIPLNEKAIQDMIVEMHYADDLQLYNEKGELLSEKQIRILAKDRYFMSEGNPRVALQLWLASMVKKDFGIVIDSNFEYSNIDIEDEVWLSLLSRMLVFGHVSTLELETLFNLDKEEIDKTISMMLKSGLINLPKDKNYEILKNIKPFVEKWLKQKELI